MLVLLILLLVCGRASSLKCFQCNSHVQPECLTNPSQFYIECPSHDPNHPGLAPFCRKVYINIFDEWNKRNEERVIRECGYQRKLKSSRYRINLDDHDEIVYQCFSDGCNWNQTHNLGSVQNGRCIVLTLLSLFVYTLVSCDAFL